MLNHLSDPPGVFFDMRASALTAIACAALTIIAGCSKPPAADLLKRAQEGEESRRKALDTMRVKPDLREFFSPVMDDYSKLVEDYEGTPESETALFRRAVVRGGDLKDVEGAIADYKLYAERYPGREKAALSLFLVGYLYNNELRQVDSAGAAYRRFLEAFPEHEMASAARYELENLGKTPDELMLQEPPADRPAVKEKHRSGA
jgi:tetratricopeptide (TPR) repeat protein